MLIKFVSSALIGALALVSVSASGEMAKTATNVKFLPSTAFKKVSGTKSQQVYFASHQMDAFSATQIPIYGKVVDVRH